MTEQQIREAMTAGIELRDFDGETGRAVEAEWSGDGETLGVRIVAPNFSRWTDALDLQLA